MGFRVVPLEPGVPLTFGDLEVVPLAGDHVNVDSRAALCSCSIPECASRSIRSSSTTIDLCLALVEEDHGRTVALQVAWWLVLYLRRPGGRHAGEERRLILNPKYRPGVPRKPFASIDAAREWVAGFFAWYNDA